MARLWVIWWNGTRSTEPRRRAMVPRQDPQGGMEMGWDAERAEDAYWQARAEGLTDAEIMAMDEPDWEDQGSTPPWSGDPDEDDEIWHTRDNTPHDPLTGDPYDITPDRVTAQDMVDEARRQLQGRGEDLQTGGYPDWTPGARELWELLAKAGNPVAQMKIIQHKITIPEEGHTMYETYGADRTLEGLRKTGLGAYNAAHGRRADAEPKTKEELMSLMAWAARRVAELEMDPKEPELDEDDGPMVVTFEVYRNGLRYAYAALRIPSGKRAGMWAITGPTSPSYLTWEGLLSWIKGINDGGKLPALRNADEWFTFHTAR